MLNVAQSALRGEAWPEALRRECTIRPIQAGEAPLDSSPEWRPGSRQDVKNWHVTKEEYLSNTGRNRSNETETRRRQRNVAYDVAIKRLRECTKRSCDSHSLREYANAAMVHLPVMASELVTLARAKRRWVSNRRRLSVFSKWMDRLYDRTTTRRRRDKTVLLQVNPEVETPVQRTQRRLEKRRVIRNKCERIKVVFFGDGSYSACSKGSCPIAKKSMIKLMAARGPSVYLDEFRTSMMCPCGESKLVDDKCSRSDSRLRCHEAFSTASSCPLAHQNGNRFDRDVLATWCMLNVAQNALRGEAWPEALRRSIPSV
jgi:hypothetical protein